MSNVKPLYKINKIEGNTESGANKRYKLVKTDNSKTEWKTKDEINNLNINKLHKNEILKKIKNIAEAAEAAEVAAPAAPAPAPAEAAEAKEEAEAKAAAKAANEEAETKKVANETEAKKVANETEAKRLANEADAKRLANEAKKVANETKKVANETEAKRVANEADAKRLANAKKVKTTNLQVNTTQLTNTNSQPATILDPASTSTLSNRSVLPKDYYTITERDGDKLCTMIYDTIETAKQSQKGQSGLPIVHIIDTNGTYTKGPESTIAAVAKGGRTQRNKKVQRKSKTQRKHKSKRK